MARRTLLTVLWIFLITFTLASNVEGQGIEPYPKAITDRAIHPETPMVPPPRNVVFTDPDFGSSMVRATDAATNARFPGTFFRTEGENGWSADSKKFSVIAKGGQDLVFAFDPKTMEISSLPNAKPGQGLLLPLRAGASFSFADPDLIYGTSDPDTLTIRSYRFSNGISAPVIDTRTCGVQPPLGSGPSVVSDDDVTTSLDDKRVSISEGGAQFGKHMFVIVYDKRFGCRWYNTETGEIGGHWGPSGKATTSDRYLIRHASLSKNGRYVRIGVNWGPWYVWDLATLNVTSCDLQCDGYGVVGYKSYVNGPAIIDDMQIAKRPLRNLAQVTQLVYPLPPPHHWGQPQHFTWSNVDVKDGTPVCGSTYSYDGDPTIDQPFAGEIFCVGTDGRASTIWRFAHDRATYIAPFFHTQPLGSISRDGHFYLFISDWDARLGMGTDGTPRSDVFIVKLE
jgi:hypothetical protein